MLDVNTNQVCSMRSYESIFQFRVAQRGIQKPEDIQSLEIVGSQFSNIFYEIGSIVRLPEHSRGVEFSPQEVPWRLSIQDTLF